VLVVDGRTFEAYNEREARRDPTAHAELLASGRGPGRSTGGGRRVALCHQRALRNVRRRADRRAHRAPDLRFAGIPREGRPVRSSIYSDRPP